MYIPDRFRLDDPEVLREFIRIHDFATIVARDGERLLVSHAPLLLSEPEAPPALRGHLAASNPMAARFEIPTPVTAIFMGPHAYIPRGWYTEHPTVPTWNYAAVYVEGTARVLKEPEELIDLLDRTTRAHEGAGGWRFDPSSPGARRLLTGVRAFEIPIDRMSGKFKLDQTESAGDRESIARGLETTGDTQHAELARLMRAVRAPER
jgi:transcriptional regulator